MQLAARQFFVLNDDQWARMVVSVLWIWAELVYCNTFFLLVTILFLFLFLIQLFIDLFFCYFLMSFWSRVLTRPIFLFYPFFGYHCFLSCFILFYKQNILYCYFLTISRAFQKYLSNQSDSFHSSSSIFFIFFFE